MAFGHHEGAGESEMSEINMIPLVDIMLVLLIIFIITVPVVTHTVTLDLPRAQNVANVVKSQTITIAVAADGAVYWDAQPVDAATLSSHLAQVAAREPQPELHIRGDRKVPYEEMIQVMAAAQKAGVQKLGFITDPAFP